MKKLIVLIPAFFFISCAGVQSRYHTVRSGETFESIAKRYSVSVDDLKDKNETLATSGLKAGRKVYVPFERNPAWNEVDNVIEKAETEEKSGVAPLEKRGAMPTDDVSSVLPSRREKNTRELLGGMKFRWPVDGSVSSRFGMRKGNPHEGIDIAAVRGTPVRSSRAGHVIYSGDGISGYGNMVIVRHNDAFATVYAHLSKSTVKKGQFVSRNQMVGKVGSTGHSSGPHLHFEIRNGRLPVDPLDYLPGQLAYIKSSKVIR